MPRPPLHILGSGSIGMVWSSSIRASFPYYPVTLLLRPHRRHQINAVNNCIDIKLSHPSNDTTSKDNADTDDTAPNERILSIPSIVLSGDSPLKESIKNVLVTTKANHAIDAIQENLHLLAPKCRIILMCNGALSVRDKLEKMLKDVGGEFSLLLASTSNGAYQVDSTTDENEDTATVPTIPHVMHAGKGKTYIEEPKDDKQFAREMAELWKASNLHGETLPPNEMNILLWQKLTANCIINPLTSILKCPNGQLLMEPAVPEFYVGVVEEVAKIALTSGLNDDRLAEQSLFQFIDSVIRNTARNKSSMLQDILKGRQTEVDHLNGFIVRKGRELGIECPANEELQNRIHELSSNPHR